MEPEFHQPDCFCLIAFKENVVSVPERSSAGTPLGLLLAEVSAGIFENSSPKYGESASR